jgi:hypothetical protein
LFGNFKFPQAEPSLGLITHPWLGSANFRLKTQNATHFARLGRQPTGLANKSNEHCIEALLKNSVDCGDHGGQCKGPIDFSIKGMKYAKCRHSFTLKDLIDKDIDDINKLLEYENYFIEKEMK